MFTMIPRVQTDKVPAILSACDAGFISFRNIDLWQKTIPSKLQSYMACGKPIIASASGETERIINESKCGICAEIGNPEALAEGIRKMMTLDNKQMGENSRSYFETHFDKKMIIDQMDQFFNPA